MLAAVLVKNGTAEKAFQLQEVAEPTLKSGTVKIKVEAFGLNFADVMARLGMYQDCPPLPAIIGYDVVGHVVEASPEATHVAVGDRVVALTRFGGYAQYALADARACAKIDSTYDGTKATALSTQYCTAWFCMQEAIRLHKGDSVLIHSAAGGVGTAMVQLALHFGYQIYATVGSQEKMDLLRKSDVSQVFNYTKQDYQKEIQLHAQSKSPLDASFNAVGGDTVKKDLRLLNAGGREVLFGASKISSASLLGKVKVALQFGFYHPIEFMMQCKSLVGVNMLQIADHKPNMISHCFENILQLANQNAIDPLVGGSFSYKELAKGHDLMENRKTVGKVAIYW